MSDEFGNAKTNQFQINTYENDDQSSPHIARFADGTIVATWLSGRYGTSEGQDGDNFGIYGQILDRNGERVGSEFQINTFAANAQENQIVEILSPDTFVVVWHSGGYSGQSVHEDIRGQIFDKSANMIGSEFTLNSTTVNSQNFPDITAAEEGGFIATWTSVGQDGSEDAIVARKFDANGIALTEEKIINSFITGRQTDPEITELSGSKSVITWTSQDQDGSYWGLYGQILNSYLDDIGNEFIINSETQGIQRLHSVDTLSDDRFVVVWENRLDDNLSSRENSTIQGQIFDSNGGMIGNQFQVNTIQQYYGMSDENSWHEPPQVIGLEEGGFFVAWDGHDNDYGGYGVDVFGQYFDDAGNKLGPEFQINTLSHEHQGRVSIVEVDGGIFTSFYNYNTQSVIRPENSINDLSGYSVSGKFIPNPNDFLSMTGEPQITDVRVNSSYYNDGQGDISLEFIFDRPVSVEFSGQAIGNIRDVENSSIRTFHYGNNGNGEFGDLLRLDNAQMREGGTVFAIDIDPNTYAGFDWPETHKFWFDALSTPINRDYKVIDLNGAETVFADLIPNEFFYDHDLSRPGIRIDDLSSGENYPSHFLSNFNDTEQISPEFDTYSTISDEIEFSSASRDEYFGHHVDTKPFISSNEDGNFLVTWTENTGSITQIYGSITYPNNYDVVPNFKINSYSGGSQDNSISVGLPSGNYAVFWNGVHSNSGGDLRSKGQILSSDGERIGDEFLISSQYASGPQPTVLSDGTILVTWRDRDSDSFGTSGRVFSETGEPIYSQFRLNETTWGNAFNAKTTELSDGNFAAVWQQGQGDGDEYSVQGRIFDLNGSWVGPEFRVNDFTPGQQQQASITSLPDGGFAVVFQSEFQDGNGIGTFLKFYDNTGQAISDEILVNTNVAGNQLFSDSSSVKSLDILPTGELVVVWQSDASGNYDIYAQKFNQNGTKIGEAYLVNTVQEGEQVSSNISVSNSGDVGIVWENQNTDNNTVQVKARLFGENIDIGDITNLLENDALIDQPITISITVSEGKYYVGGILQDSIRLDAGNTYVFDYSAAIEHPLSLSTTPDGTHGSGSNYINGVSDLGNNQLQIEVTENTPDLYYFCQNHPGMGGSAQVVSDIVTISENSDAGSTVGITAYAEEVDAGDSVSYALTNDAGGLFAVDSTTGVVTLSGSEEQLSATPISIREFSFSDIQVTGDLVFYLHDSNGRIEQFNYSAPHDTLDYIVRMIEGRLGAWVGPDMGFETQLVQDELFGTRNYPFSSSDSNTNSLLMVKTGENSRYDELYFVIEDEFGNETIINPDENVYPSIEHFNNRKYSELSEYIEEGNLAPNQDVLDFSLIDYIDTGNDSGHVGRIKIIDEASGLDVNIAQWDHFSASDQGFPNEYLTYYLTSMLTGRVDLHSNYSAEQGGDRLEYGSYHLEQLEGNEYGYIYDASLMLITKDDGTEIDTKIVYEDLTNGVGNSAIYPQTIDAIDENIENIIIENNDGSINYNQNVLDYETATSHDITVLASSTDGSTSEAIFNVAVQDFDEYDVLIESILPVELDEDAGIGDTIAIAYADDLDGTDTVSYVLSQSAGGLFAIDSMSGFITLADELNYKQDASHSITVLATSTDGSTDEATYDITVNDKNSVSGNGDDKIYGNRVDEVLYGHGGDDLIDGGKGRDELYGGAGDDRLSGGNKDKSADRLFGEDGNDKLYGGKGNDYLEGGADDDRLYGGAHKDQLFGGIGNDKLFGGSGNDKLFGEDGDDYLRGDKGNDRLNGGDGDDYLRGDRGNDRLNGGNGDDALYGNVGKDILKGGKGDDVLNGGEGNDTLWGGLGADIFQFNQLVNTDVIRDFQSQDVVEFLYKDGVDDISTDAVQIEQRGGDTQINWGGVELNLDGYATFYFEDIRFTMI